MNKILVLTDFSKHAGYAARAAAKLASNTGASIQLLHVEVTPWDIIWEELSDDEKATFPETVKRINDAEEKLKQLVGQAYFHELDVDYKIGYDMGFHHVDEYAQGSGFDLIIIGSHGAKGFKEMFIGSNAQKLVRQSETPVLTIKEYSDDMKFDKIVFASSFVAEVDPVFPVIGKIATSLSAELHLLYINTPATFENSGEVYQRMKRVSETYPDGNYKFDIYNDFSEEEGISEFANWVDADIIAIATHHKKGVRAMFSSLTEKLVNHSDIPVLSLSYTD